MYGTSLKVNFGKRVDESVYSVFTKFDYYNVTFDNIVSAGVSYPNLSYKTKSKSITLGLMAHGKNDIALVDIEAGIGLYNNFDNINVDYMYNASIDILFPVDVISDGAYIGFGYDYSFQKGVTKNSLVTDKISLQKISLEFKKLW